MHTITVTISEKARREAVLAGLPAQSEQEYEIPTELLPDLFDLGAKLNNSGSVSLKVGRLYTLDIRPEDAKSAIILVKNKVMAYHNNILTKAMGGEYLTWNETRILSPEELNAYNHLRTRVQQEKYARARADIARKKAEQEEARAKLLSDENEKSVSLLKAHKAVITEELPLPRDSLSISTGLTGWQDVILPSNLLDMFFIP